MADNNKNEPRQLDPQLKPTDLSPNADSQHPKNLATSHLVKEPEIWSGRPSHIINFKYHLITILSLLLIPPIAGALFDLFQWDRHSYLYLVSTSPLILAPLLYSLWKIIKVHCDRYILTTERLRHNTGVFNKLTQEIELYRIRDTELHEPFLMRFVDAGNIIIISNDASTPRFTIPGIKQAHTFRELLRSQVETCRQQKGIREWITAQETK